MFTIFRNRLLTAVVTGHLVVDMLNSTGPVLLALLATSHSWSNTQVGVAFTLYTLAGALSQPPFGWLADRVRIRPTLLGGVGVAWTALCYTVVALTRQWEIMLPFFLLAALGSGLFHPIGTSHAGMSNRKRAASATSIFFFGGQVGLALGPALGGVLLGAYGSVGILPISIAAIVPVTLLLSAPAAPVVHAHDATARSNQLRSTAVLIAAFIALVALRSSIQQAYTLFLPKLFADRGWEPGAYGALAGTFMFASAVGNVITGGVADRFGMRNATVWPLLLSVPAALFCISVSSPLISFVAAALAGLLIGGQHSVLVVHAQRLLPTGAGFASGLILGFTFAAGAFGTWLGGLAADQFGLLPVMAALALLAIPAALLALTLPRRPRATPEVALAAERSAS